MRHKKAITKELMARYNKATKKEKGIILDEFTALTEYNALMPPGYLKQKKKRS